MFLPQEVGASGRDIEKELCPKLYIYIYIYIYIYKRKKKFLNVKSQAEVLAVGAYMFES